jgi:hypothetical protein
VDWIMSTRPGSQGTVTANTYVQLDTKTWTAIRKWTNLCITAPWFDISGTKMAAKEAPEDWFCTPQSCREENSEAFAGQHAATATSFYVFDEASAVPDGIYEVSEGGLTDGEPMAFMFGNPTRNTGKFYRANFGSEQHRWNHRSIDSRSCRFPNKKLHAEWIEDYGIDSDFVRVRVRGLPPMASESQFIDWERIKAAQARIPRVLIDDPLIAGVDVSGGGAAWNVVRFRRGNDGRNIPPIRIPGEKTRNDRGMFLAVLAELLREGINGIPIAMMFIDSAFGSPYVERLRQLGFDNVQEVNFGGKSPNDHQANWRAYMWYRTKEWLTTGCIPADDFGRDKDKLAADLALPGFHLNLKDQLVLESKEDIIDRGEASPDDGDAFALTFAAPVAPRSAADTAEYRYDWRLG